MLNDVLENRGAGVAAPVTGSTSSALYTADGKSGALPVWLRLLLWSGGFGLALWLALAYGGGVRNDFTQNVWLPARLVLDGANPYFASRPEIDTALGQFASQFDLFNSGREFHFIYPMWLALVLTPFAALPLPESTALWRALNLLLLVWSVGAILRSSNPTFRLRTPAVFGAMALTVGLAIFYRESLLTLIIGQFAIVELGLLAAIWAWLVRSGEMDERARLLGDALTGVALAVLATKPQAVGLPVALLGLWALSRRRFTIPVVAAGSLLLLFSVPLILYPGSLGDWLAVVFGGQAASQAEVSASVWGVSYHLFGDGSAWRLLAGALTVVGIAALLPRWWHDLRDKTAPLPMSLLLTLCVNSVISPYMLGYEHVLLLLPALVLIAAAGLPQSESAQPGAANYRRLRLAMYTWMAILPLLVVSIQGGLEREWPAIAQSVPMLVILWTTRVGWRDTNGQVAA